MPEDPSDGPIFAISAPTLLIQSLQKASLADAEQDRDGYMRGQEYPKIGPNTQRKFYIKPVHEMDDLLDDRLSEKDSGQNADEHGHIDEDRGQ
jgi:hypothetical protein